MSVLESKTAACASLADEIIEAQRRETAEMKWLIEDIERNGIAASAAEVAARPVPLTSPTDGTPERTECYCAPARKTLFGRLYSEDSMQTQARDSNTAVLYRMVMPDHVCPYGIKSKDLLEREGYEVDDRHLETREETDAFEREHDVDTTPQTFIDGSRVGGYDDLREYFGKATKNPDETTYQPVIALFAMTLFMALMAAFVAENQWFSVRTVEWFVAFSMCGLAFLKLRDVESFSTMFLNYDLLARRWVPYGYVYPFAEGLAGVLMIGEVALWLAIPLALFIGTVGALSVFKAVYIDERELKCACVGGDSNVPLGFVSLTENLLMVAIGLWMASKSLVWH